jgi:serine/threonine protein kinase
MPADTTAAHTPMTGTGAETEAPRFRVRFRLQEAAGGAQAVDVVECAASRRLLVDKHALATERAAVDAAMRELDLLLTLQQPQEAASSALSQTHRRHLRDHVVQLAGYHLEDDRLHVLTEFCARGDLLRAIEREARLVRAGLLAPLDGRTTSVRGVRALFRQALRGVAALHAAGVAHLDLSLENVLLTDTGVVKIADFGHAVRVQEGSKQRVSVAKDAYASPEMFDAQNGPLAPPVDAFKCDAWALGVVLFKLCAKREFVARAGDNDAFVAELRASGTRRALQRRIMRESSASASAPSSGSCSLFEADARAPPALIDLLSRLLDVDPSSRLSVAAALQHPFLSDEVARQVAAASSSVNIARQLPAASQRTTTTVPPKPERSVSSSRLTLKMAAGSPEKRRATYRRTRTQSAEIALEDTRVAMLRPSITPSSAAA